MEAQKQLDLVNEVTGQLEPRIAHKFRIMFSHWGDADADMDELMLLNFLLIAATLIDRYV